MMGAEGDEREGPAMEDGGTTASMDGLRTMGGGFWQWRW
jgi:hypothetical protein